MEAIVLKNFKYGLDTRRDLLTSQPGTLVTLQDAHINQGAEIEGRKAFVKVGSIPIGATQPTFDLLATASSLVTFGSYTMSRTTTQRTRTSNVATLVITNGVLGGLGANPYRIGDVVNISGVGGSGYNGNNITITNVVANAISYASVAANEGVTGDTGGTVALVSFSGLVAYQQFTHPIQTLINTFVIHMTGVTASCCFNGQAFVSATFGGTTDNTVTYSTDGGNIWFYNGNPIPPNYLGVVHIKGVASYTNQVPTLASELAGQVSFYLGKAFTGAFVVPSFVTITGPVNGPFAVTTSVNSTYGTFIDDTVYDVIASAPVTGVNATSVIYLISGAGGQVTSIVDSNAVNIIAAPVPFVTSLYVTAQNVVAAINARTTTTGYTAAAAIISNTVASITVSGPLLTGATQNAIIMTVVTATIKQATTSDAAGATGSVTYSFAGGVTAKSAASQQTYLQFLVSNGGQQWAYEDTWTLTIVYNNTQYTLGAGNVANLTPTFAMALGTKVNILAGTTWAFSKVGDATRWEQQDTGAGTITVADQNFSPSPLVAMAPFQGKVAIFAQQNAQIWNGAALPSQYNQAQIFQNVGAVAAQSVQALGELDVFFLSYFGIRSFRVLETTLNAFLTDVGSPIDSLILASLLSNTPSNNAAACGAIEPTSHRYFLFLNGTIYVLSYFPSLKISAWSTYTPTFLTNLGTPGSNVTFTYTLVPGVKYYFSPGNCISALDGGPGGVTIFPGGQALDGSFVATNNTLVVTTSSFNLPGTAQLVKVNSFTPIKMVVFGTSVYILANDGSIYQYGGASGTSYDGTVAVVELPWLDDGDPLSEKKLRSVAWVTAGKWVKYYATDPLSGPPIQYHIFDNSGSDATPSVLTDSSFPYSGKCGISGTTTHFKALLYSDFLNTGQVLLGAFALTYEPGVTR